MIGAVLIGVLLEVLRDPGDSRVLFYSVIVLGLFAALRLSVKLVAVLGGLFVFGVIVHTIAGAIDDTWTNGSGGAGGGVARLHGPLGRRAEPRRPTGWRPSRTSRLVALALVLTLLRGWVRLAVLVPVLYLAPSSGRTSCSRSPSRRATSSSACSSIALMIVRPSGLLGEKRVEII